MPKQTEFLEAMARALAGREARVLLECQSTNDLAREWAREGAGHLAVVVADAQTAGRGRNARTWTANKGDALLVSIILRPSQGLAAWGLLPLLAGVAVSEAVQSRAGIRTGLKWPNDVLADGGKIAGVLCEAQIPEFVVCGIGVNVSDAPRETGASSLAAQGATRLDRADLLAEILNQLEMRLSEGSDAWREAWLARSITVGKRVRASLANGTTVEGTATGIDDAGGLLINSADGVQVVLAGDVQHLRAV